MHILRDSTGWLRKLDFYHCCGLQDGIPGSWFWPGSAVVVVGHWGAADGRSLAVSLPFKHKKNYLSDYRRQTLIDWGSREMVHLFCSYWNAVSSWRPVFLTKGDLFTRVGKCCVIYYHLWKLGEVAMGRFSKKDISGKQVELKHPGPKCWVAEQPSL